MCPNKSSQLYKAIESVFGTKAANNFYIYITTPEFLQWKGDDLEPSFSVAGNSLYIENNLGDREPVQKGIYFMAKVAGYEAGFVGVDGRYKTYLPQYYNTLRNRVIKFNTSQPHYLATIVKGLSSEPGDRRDYFAVNITYKKSSPALQEQRLPFEITDTVSKKHLTDVVEKLQKKFGIKGVVINDPTVSRKGWFENGVAFVNAAYATPDTPYHEFIHPFIEAIATVNRPLYLSLIEDIKREGKVLEKVKRLYPEYTSEDQLMEAIVQAIGMVASNEVTDPSLLRKLKLVLETVMRFLREFYPHSVYLPNELPSTLTLEDMGILVASDIRFELGEVMPKMYDQRFGDKDEQRMMAAATTDAQKDTIQSLINAQAGIEKIDEDHYKDAEGNIYSRVSSIIGSTYTGPSVEGGRQAGTQIHSIAEAVTKGDSLPQTPLLIDKVKSYAETMFQKLIAQETKDGSVVLSEVTFYDKDKGYAGTEDFVFVKPDGSLKFVDIKTSKYTTKDHYYSKPNEGNGIIRSKKQDHRLQLSHYAALATAMGYTVANEMEIIPIRVSTIDNIVTRIEQEPTITLDYNKEGVEEREAIFKGTGATVTPLNPETQFTRLFTPTITEQQRKVFDTVKVALTEQLNLLNKTVLGGTTERAVKQRERINRLELLKQQLIGENILEEVANVVNTTYDDVLAIRDNFNAKFTVESLNKAIALASEKGDMTQLQRLIASADTANRYAKDYSYFSEIKSIYQQGLEAGAKVEEGSTLAKIRDVIEAVGDIERKYREGIKPLVAAILASELPSNIANATAELTSRIEKWKAIVREKKALGKDTKEFEDKITQLNKELDSYGTDVAKIARQLTEVTSDIGSLEYYTGTAINNGDSVISLYFKRLKSAEYRRDEASIELQRKAAIELLKFEKATGRNRNNPADFYKGMYERRKMYKYNPETDAIDSREEVALVERINLSKFSMEEAKMRKQAARMDGDVKAKFISQWYKANQSSKSMEQIEEIVKQKQEELDPEKYTEWYAKNINEYNGNTQFLYDLAEPNTSSVAKYLNPSWVALEAPENKASKEFHTFLWNMYKEAQAMYPLSSKMGARLPSVPKELEDAIRDGGFFKSIGQSLKDAVSPSIVRDTLRYGSSDSTIPVYYVQQIPPDDVSLDLVASILRFSQAAATYKLRSTMEPEGNAILYLLQNRDILKTDATGNQVFKKIKSLFGGNAAEVETQGGNAAKFFEHFFNQNIYGRGEEKTLIKLSDGKYLDVGKTVNTFMALASFTQIGGPFNVLKGAANKLAAEMNIIVESFGARYFDRSDYLKGKATYDKWAFSGNGFIADMNSPFPKSKQGQLMMMFSPIQGGFADSLGRDMTSTFFKKAFSPSTWYFLQGAGEHSAQMSMFFAMMHSTKVKSGDREISLYEAYEMKDGQVKLKEGVVFDNKQRDEFVNRIHAINKQLHGVYNKADKSILQKATLGRLVAMYRKYLAPAVKRRWSDTRIDMELGDVTEGFYRTIFKAAMNDYQELAKFIIGKGGNFTDFEKANIRRAMTEIVGMVSLTLITAILVGWRDDDEQFRKNEGLYGYTMNAILYEVLRLNSEFQFYLPPFGIDDNLRVFTSPSAAFNHLGNILKLIKALMPWNWMEEYDTNSKYHTKGDLKLPTAALKVLGVNSADPSKAMQQFNQYLQ